MSQHRSPHRAFVLVNAFTTTAVVLPAVLAGSWFSTRISGQVTLGMVLLGFQLAILVLTAIRYDRACR
jgi:hypothetical protein